MKTLKLLSVLLVITLFTSCYTEVIVDDYNSVNPPVTENISLDQLLRSYELWYIDLNKTQGYGSTPFMEIAFTMSFKNGILYANNNLVGIGSQGNGFGVDIANYDAYNMVLNINHIIDGFTSFDVYQIDYNTIELYNINNDTSYFLHGYQRNSFDYDLVFYNNIHYFLQEYEAWEKTYTSTYGNLNEFDNENYLQFLRRSNSDFKSSQDQIITNPSNLYWDYSGVYGITNANGNIYKKHLTLDYHYFNDEYFELTVINDQTIELFHPISGTLYEFKGKNYIAFYKQGKLSDKKKRKQHSPKVKNIREPRTR